jgi:hypothetical protein
MKSYDFEQVDQSCFHDAFVKDHRHLLGLALLFMRTYQRTRVQVLIPAWLKEF